MDINFQIEDQVVGIELAAKLKRLGARQDSYFVWHKEKLMPRIDLSQDVSEDDVFAAFTSQELGWKLPKTAKCGNLGIYLGMDKSAASNEMEIWYEKSDGAIWRQDCYMGTINEEYNRGCVLAVLLENGAVHEDGTPLR